MRHERTNEEKNLQIRKVHKNGKDIHADDFVLEKSIFNNIFEKDIQRIYIYKKAERLGKAIYLIAPAFIESVSLKNRIDAVAIGLIDAALLPPMAARGALARELLALSSVLSIARTGGILSPMNTDLITREAQLLLHEIAAYEEPRVFIDEAPTLATLARELRAQEPAHAPVVHHPRPASRPTSGAKAGGESKGHIKDNSGAAPTHIKDRREAILSVIKDKRSAHIKDFSTFIRGISEKTIQRELSALVSEGIVVKRGERRWSTYSLS